VREKLGALVNPILISLSLNLLSGYWAKGNMEQDFQNKLITALHKAKGIE